MKPQQILGLIIWVIAIAVIFALGYSIIYGAGNGKPEMALHAYQKGEKSRSAADKEAAFNEALSLYKQLEKDYSANSGSGALYYNIANTYFQLAQYPAAILYYHKALKVDPWNDDAWNNLQVAYSKLNLPVQKSHRWLDVVFSPELGMSEPERFQLLFGTALAALIFGSFFIWKEIHAFKKYALLAALACMLLLISLGISIFFKPTEAIVLRPTLLYRDAGKQYAGVQEAPLAEGEKLQVLEMVDDGQWVKVRTSNGVQGFVPVEKVGVI